MSKLFLVDLQTRRYLRTMSATNSSVSASLQGSHWYLFCIGPPVSLHPSQKTRVRSRNTRVSLAPAWKSPPSCPNSVAPLAPDPFPPLCDDPIFLRMQGNIAKLRTVEIKLLLEYTGLSTRGSRRLLIDRFAKFETYVQVPSRRRSWAQVDKIGDQADKFDHTDPDNELQYQYLRQLIRSDDALRDRRVRATSIDSPCDNPDPFPTTSTPNDPLEMDAVESTVITEYELDREFFHVESDLIIGPATDENVTEVEPLPIQPYESYEETLRVSPPSSDHEESDNGDLVDRERVAENIEERLTKLREPRVPEITSIPAFENPPSESRSHRVDRAIIEIFKWSIRFALESGDDGKKFLINAAKVFRVRGKRKRIANAERSSPKGPSQEIERVAVIERSLPNNSSPILTPKSNNKTLESPESNHEEPWTIAESKIRRHRPKPPPPPRIRPLMAYPIARPPPCYEVPALRHLLDKPDSPRSHSTRSSPCHRMPSPDRPETSSLPSLVHQIPSYNILNSANLARVVTSPSRPSYDCYVVSSSPAEQKVPWYRLASSYVQVR